jgi:nucleotide-binding universal stress UspA family protein
VFQRILVPLDGSDLAGRILTQVARLLEHGEEVTLLLVVQGDRLSEREREEGSRLDDGLALRLRAARADLAAYLERLEAAGVSAKGDVLIGEPSEVIVSQAVVTEPSLVAMASHGRGGLGRWVRGSVAEQVLRRTPVPVLMVTPRAHGRPELFRRILVPLDGSERSAAIIPFVSQLAKLHDSEVVLLRVGLVDIAPLAGGGVPAWAPQPPTLDDDALRSSIAPYAAELERAGVSTRTLVRLSGSPAHEILETVSREEADLVAMATHGRTGLDRMVFGSVAEKVLRHCTTPLLVLRPDGMFDPRAGAVPAEEAPKATD